jgi:hypothetical protein
MFKCGYVVHNQTMPLALARQSELVQSGQGATPSKKPSSAFPKISTQYERLIAPLSTSFWYIRAWTFLKNKIFDE